MNTITIDQLKKILVILDIDPKTIKCPKCGASFEDSEGEEPEKPTTKPFPHEIAFERASDQGNGSAAILFRTLKNDDITYVSVNGEVARKGNPYKGCPVFLLTKSGENYKRPLKFIIKDNKGNSYSYVSSDEESEGDETPAGEYTHKETYTSYGVRNGRQAWRIPKKGPEFGSQIKFVFSSGKEFTVYNTSKNCRDVPRSCGRNSKAPMYGFVFKPGIGPNGDGDNDTGTAHGGIYLHAPYGDSSKTVTLYYNGK